MKKVTWVIMVGLAFWGGWILGARMVQPVEMEEGSADQVRDTKELRSLRERLKGQAKKIASLEAALEESNKKLLASSPPVVEDVSEPENGFRRQMDIRMSRRVDSLAEKYGLDAMQKEALRAVYAKRVASFEARRRGEEVEPLDFDAELEKIMSAEQFAAYLEDSQQEIYDRAELMATSQIVRMNQLLNLDPAIEGVVYEAVHLTAQEMMIARQTGEAYPMREVMDERLGSLLTEEQMQTLREGSGGFGMGFGGRGMGPGSGP